MKGFATGEIYFVLKSKKREKISSIISFVNVWIGVNGIQSPKQPQALILPVNNTKLVKKVKKSISNNNIHTVSFFRQPSNKATPTATSSVIIIIENDTA